MLAYGGLRWGEAAALRRGRCDLLHRRVQVSESLSGGSRLAFGPPKTHRVRSVTLPAFVCERLARHLDEFVPVGADQLVFTTALLIANGAGPKSVQAQLGHATITTTFDTYGHLFAGHLDEVMERLDADWRRSRAAHTRPTAPSQTSGDVIEWPG